MASRVLRFQTLNPQVHLSPSRTMNEWGVQEGGCPENKTTCKCSIMRRKYIQQLITMNESNVHVLTDRAEKQNKTKQMARIPWQSSD